MLKKKITYTDYNGVEHTEDFYFNLSKAELAEMEFSARGGLAKKIDRLVASEDAKEIIQLFKEIIIRSYGKKSTDGLRFMKTQEIIDEFVQSEAYSVLFIELMTNPEAASAFISGVMPQAPSSN